jgi:hypothetical protein
MSNKPYQTLGLLVAVPLPSTVSSEQYHIPSTKWLQQQNQNLFSWTVQVRNLPIDRFFSEHASRIRSWMVPWVVYINFVLAKVVDTTESKSV